MFYICTIIKNKIKMKGFTKGQTDEIYGKVVNVKGDADFQTVTFENNVIKHFSYDEEFNLMMEI